MKPYYQDDHVTLYHGDALAMLADLPDESVHAVVTDPPYALEFMGRKWDGWDSPAAFQQWCGAWARECLRVLKPGGHMLAFGGSRTWHRLASAVEDARFEIRDSIAWLYGSGFPKSLDVSKAIDKAAGVERTEGAREWVGGQRRAGVMGENMGTQTLVKFDAPATPAAQTWQGWGTALKPAFEPIVVARKPLVGTVAANVLAFGTGALNVDGCRVGTDDVLTGSGSPPLKYAGANHRPFHDTAKSRGVNQHPAGRWPANVVLDDSQAAELDRQSGKLTSGANPARRGTDKFRDAYGDFKGQEECTPARGADTGGASRFFPTFRYEAKAPASERPRVDGVAHPTVKPLALMQFLVRLVTPPGGVVLEPFAGSGTTLEAALAEGFACIGVEREADYLPLIMTRIAKPVTPPLDIEVTA